MTAVYPAEALSPQVLALQPLSLDFLDASLSVRLAPGRLLS